MINFDGSRIYKRTQLVVIIFPTPFDTIAHSHENTKSEDTTRAGVSLKCNVGNHKSQECYNEYCKKQIRFRCQKLDQVKVFKPLFFSISTLRRKCV